MSDTILGIGIFGTGQGLSFHGIGALHGDHVGMFEFGPHLSRTMGGAPIDPGTRRFYFSSAVVDGRPATVIAAVEPFRDFRHRDGYVGGAVVVPGEVRSASQVSPRIAGWFVDMFGAIKQPGAGATAGHPVTGYAGSAWADDAVNSRNQTSFFQQLLSEEKLPPRTITASDTWHRGGDVPVRPAGAHPHHPDHRPQHSAAPQAVPERPSDAHARPDPAGKPPHGPWRGRLALVGTIGSALASVAFAPSADAKTKAEDVRLAFGANIADAVAITGGMNPSHNTVTGEIFHAVNREVIGATRAVYNGLFETRTKPAIQPRKDAGPSPPPSM